MALAMVPALADDPPTSGTCGASGNEANVTWKLTPNNTDPETYTLTISGKGAMKDYDGWGKQPWSKSLGKATKFVVEDDVTNIGAYATNCLNRIEEYVIGKDVTTIGGFGISTDNAKTFTLRNNTRFKIVDGVLFSADGKTLYAYPGGRETIGVYEVPQDVTTVVDGAFVGAKMNKLIIHNKINGIPSWTFQRCTVEYLELNETDTVGTPDTNIHEAFRGLNIKDLKIAGGKIGRMEFDAYEYTGAPANPKLEKVTITELPTVPQGLVTDGHKCFGVFWGQSHLTTVDLSQCGNVGNASEGTFKDTQASMIAFYFDKTESADNFRSTDAYESENAVFAVLNGGSIPSTEGWYKEQFALAAPERPGYNFDGWYMDEQFTQKLEESTQLTVGSTYYANWTEKPIKFEANGGTGTMPNEDYIVNQLTDTEPPSYSIRFPACGFTAPAGQEFAGWKITYPEDLVNNTVHLAGDERNIGKEAYANVTVTAQWKAKQSEQQPSGGGYWHPTTTPVPVIVIPPKTGDMTVWQSILHFLGIR